MSCQRCDRDIRAFDRYMSVKGVLLCEDCASPKYDNFPDGTKCYSCGKRLDPDDDKVLDVYDGDYMCAECVEDELQEYDPEGDAADDWYSLSRDELRGY